MKAFLLAAGHGTRLRPLTDTVPKCLLPVAGTPILGLWLQLLGRHGVDEVLINLHAHAEAVRSYLCVNPPPLSVRLVHEPDLLGSAGTLRHNRAWIGTDDLVWVCYADVLTNCDLDRVFAHHRSQRELATLLLCRVPDPARCGIAEVANGRITAFQEKPEKPRSNLAFAGVMLLQTEALDSIPDHSPCDIGGDLLPRLQSRMAYTELKPTEFLMDIGTLENYHWVQEHWPGIPEASAGAGR